MLGRALYDPPTVRLSAWLDEAQAQDTLRHELAHVAVGHGRRARREGPHGATWREWAARLGAAPRAQASGPPAHAPERASGAQAWGLVCAACGERFVRRRVLRGLYHRECGPRGGRLERALRDSVEVVRAWAARRPAEPVLPALIADEGSSRALPSRGTDTNTQMAWG